MLLAVPPEQDPMAEILLRCLHQNAGNFPNEQLSAMAETEWGKLAAMAIEHRVVPLFYHRLRSKGLHFNSAGFERAMEKLQAYTRQVSKNNLRFYGELRKLLKRFNQAGISAIPLKGIYLAEKIYRNPGMREMNDMDILFRVEDLERAYNIVNEMGYEPLKPVNDGKISYLMEASAHLPRMIRENTAGVELHWNIAKPGRKYSIDPDELWERAVPVTITGEKAMALSPEGLLLHQCLHTSYEHMFSFGLRPFYDIAMVIDYYGNRLDLDAFIERANRYRWSRGVFIALSIARDFSGAAISDEVLARLRPSPYNPDMLMTAKAQILTQKETSKKVSMTMVDFAAADSGIGKAQTVLNRIFLPKEKMAAKYPVRPDSPMLHAYYIFRFWNMLFLHTRRILKISSGKSELSEIAARKHALQHWMRGD